MLGLSFKKIYNSWSKLLFSWQLSQSRMPMLRNLSSILYHEHDGLYGQRANCTIRDLTWELKWWRTTTTSKAQLPTVIQALLGGLP